MRFNQVRTYFSAGHRLLCTFGMLVHVWFVSDHYLKYETTSLTNVGFPLVVNSPALSICFRYGDILDTEFVAKKLGENYKSVTQRLEQIRRDITLDEVFQHTPPGEQLLTGAFIRDSKNYTVRQLNQKQSIEHFEISRFQTLMWMCYRFQPRLVKTFNYRLVASSSSFAGMIYSVFIQLSKKRVNRTMLMMPLVHTYNDYPTLEYLHAPHVGIAKDSTVNLYRLNSQKFETKFLRYPYKTDCTDYGERDDDGIDQPQLISDCIVKSTIDRLKMIPFSEFKIENKFEFSSNLKLMDPNSRFGNSSIGLEFKKIEHECKRLYPKLDCEDYVHLTQIQSRENWPIEDWHFRIGQPTSPTIRTVYQPMEDFYTFSLLVLSCFGVWIGSSLIDLNLVDFYVKVERLMNQRTVDRSNLMTGSLLTRHSRVGLTKVIGFLD